MKKSILLLMLGAHFVSIPAFAGDDENDKKPVNSRKLPEKTSKTTAKVENLGSEDSQNDLRSRSSKGKKYTLKNLSGLFNWHPKKSTTGSSSKISIPTQNSTDPKSKSGTDLEEKNNSTSGTDFGNDYGGQTDMFKRSNSTSSIGERSKASLNNPEETPLKVFKRSTSTNDIYYLCSNTPPPTKENINTSTRSESLSVVSTSTPKSLTRAPQPSKNLKQDLEDLKEEEYQKFSTEVTSSLKNLTLSDEELKKMSPDTLVDWNVFYEEVNKMDEYNKVIEEKIMTISKNTFDKEFKVSMRKFGKKIKELDAYISELTGIKMTDFNINVEQLDLEMRKFIFCMENFKDEYLVDTNHPSGLNAKAIDKRLEWCREKSIGNDITNLITMYFSGFKKIKRSKKNIIFAKEILDKLDDTISKAKGRKNYFFFPLLSKKQLLLAEEAHKKLKEKENLEKTQLLPPQITFSNEQREKLTKRFKNSNLDNLKILTKISKPNNEEWNILFKDAIKQIDLITLALTRMEKM